MCPYAGLHDEPSLAPCAESLCDLPLSDQPGVICIARTNESTRGWGDCVKSCANNTKLCLPLSLLAVHSGNVHSFLLAVQVKCLDVTEGLLWHLRDPQHRSIHCFHNNISSVRAHGHVHWISENLGPSKAGSGISIGLNTTLKGSGPACAMPQLELCWQFSSKCLSWIWRPAQVPSSQYFWWLYDPVEGWFRYTVLSSLGVLRGHTWRHTWDYPRIIGFGSGRYYHLFDKRGREKISMEKSSWGSPDSGRTRRNVKTAFHDTRGQLWVKYGHTKLRSFRLRIWFLCRT